MNNNMNYIPSNIPTNMINNTPQINPIDNMDQGYNINENFLQIYNTLKDIIMMRKNKVKSNPNSKQNQKNNNMVIDGNINNTNVQDGNIMNNNMMGMNMNNPLSIPFPNPFCISPNMNMANPLGQLTPNNMFSFSNNNNQDLYKHEESEYEKNLFRNEHY